MVQRSNRAGGAGDGSLWTDCPVWLRAAALLRYPGPEWRPVSGCSGCGAPAVLTRRQRVPATRAPVDAVTRGPTPALRRTDAPWMRRRRARVHWPRAAASSAPVSYPPCGPGSTCSTAGDVCVSGRYIGSGSDGDGSPAADDCDSSSTAFPPQHETCGGRGLQQRGRRFVTRRALRARPRRGISCGCVLCPRAARPDRSVPGCGACCRRSAADVRHGDRSRGLSDVSRSRGTPGRGSGTSSTPSTRPT
jgi:hypothetical protein